MFCPSCGVEASDDARFCGECGESITPPQAAEPVHAQAAQVVNTGAPAPEVSDGLKWGVLAASVIIPLVGIIMGIVYLATDNDEKKSVGKLWLMVGIGVGVLWALASGGY